MTLTSTPLAPSSAETHPAASPGPPLKASELLKHPAFSSNDWSKRIPPTSDGKVQVNVSRKRPGGAFDIAYELHGSGPTKIVWIMGLGAFKSAWKRQSKYFGHDDGRGEKYSSLVFDNRGVGRSGKPWCRYSTKEMAGDIVELLGGLGWLDKDVVNRVMADFYGARKGGKAKAGGDQGVKSYGNRDLVIAGVSMGGMIAQELALLIPEHIRTLFLISTCPRLVRTVPFIENLRQRVNMFIPKDVDVQLEEVCHRLFSKKFLEAKDTENEDESLNFPTNRDRWAASELEKRMDTEGFTKAGFVLQAIAAGWHSKSKGDLQQIVQQVGGDRICVMHGTIDPMLVYRHFELLKEEMGEDSGVEFRTWDDQGHVIMWEEEAAFNKEVEDFIEKTGKIR